MRLISSWARTSSRFKLLRRHVSPKVDRKWKDFLLFWVAESVFRLGRRIVPLLVLDVLFLQLDVFQLPLELLQICVFVSAISRGALEIIDARNGGMNGLLVKLSMIRILDENVAHLDEIALEQRTPRGRLS